MKKHLIKATIFLLLLGVFYICGGFDCPPFDDYVGRIRRRFMTLWVLSVALYVIGAYAVLWGDKIEGGTLHPTSLRWFYVLVGILAMIGGLVIMRGVKWVDAPPRTTTHHMRQLDGISPGVGRDLAWFEVSALGALEPRRIGGMVRNQTV